LKRYIIHSNNREEYNNNIADYLANVGGTKDSILYNPIVEEKEKVRGTDSILELKKQSGSSFSQLGSIHAKKRYFVEKRGLSSAFD
jgi:hypothetical protein